jgi:oxalate---CoA ligase
MTASNTLSSILSTAPDHAVALNGSSASPLSYGELRALTQETISTLNRMGVGRDDRVAIVLRNGPHAAAAFLAIVQAATVVPLNPAYKAEELESYLSGLGVKALVVAVGDDTPAFDVAKRLGIAVLTMSPRGSGAGDFVLSGAAGTETARPGPAGPDDIALILSTSGTTSRPKIVPLSQHNIVFSALNIAKTLKLGEGDRGLNIMPLFHVHGIVAGLLAPLSGGGSVFCTTGYNPSKFFGWMREADPTWYTAVPTMHQGILGFVSESRDVIAQHKLRFIRSSSAALPFPVIRELETVFQAPVIEAYGMTEAAHQVASNSLHGPRKPGSVGAAAGPEVEIFDEHGSALPTGCVGEIVIRGDNVTVGYENNPQANAQSFINGWFRTGDQGFKDVDGYIHLTGRLKEIINRGGEKISPYEVDAAMMNNPAVKQAVTFSIPDERLGEDVAAAVVLREGASLSEQDLKSFLSGRLAPFKVPRKIVFVDEIPVNATGKLQRAGLAERLGLVAG